MISTSMIDAAEDPLHVEFLQKEMADLCRIGRPADGVCRSC